MIHNGQCHCGKVSVSFESKQTPEELGVRTCQCVFCRRHGAVNISDAAGQTTITCDPDDIERYRFALRTADFLICKTCGVYLAAVMGKGERICSTINVIGLMMEAFFNIDEAPMDYDAETTEDRIERRYTKWTPTRFTHIGLAEADFGPHD